MTSTMTPPMASFGLKRSPSEDSLDEAYFLKTYVPLSNLPTPPLSCFSDSSSEKRHSLPEVLHASAEHLDPDLLGPSIHITNLIPTSTSLSTPSMLLVHAILTRANLPLETLALAACILDSLNSKFARSWRMSCPLETPPTSPIRTNFPDEEVPAHIDTIRPELIAVCGLILATKFVHDVQQDTRHYVEDWDLALWSCDQINFTQRCIMENLGYRLLPLWQEDIIIGALEDMERAAIHSDVWDDIPSPIRSSFIFDDRTTVQGPGDLVTPAETPIDENCRGTRDITNETRNAFSMMDIGDSRMIALVMPDNKEKSEPFPLYVDPMEAEWKSEADYPALWDEP
ncbi:hypothetical protein BP6252_04285 [Coleophoma cylindrospora]|uniref:Cyclin N-terminal domain-containing protein n=1 Tax=Coleophoma cylindrospora TaxID=1849047 RepID=A0A3D8S018_9HELO|nr:hypothetical protein BP6252_04285 [Coleophoma cylindrospora]